MRDADSGGPREPNRPSSDPFPFTSIDEGFCICELLLDSRGKAYDLRYLETNPAFVRHTGFSNVEGRTYGEVTGAALEPHWLALLEEVVRGGESKHAEGHAGALGRWYEVSVGRVGRAEERRLAVVFKDIGERKRGEALMQLALEREQAARGAAEAATALRDELLSVVSHELRTPLSAIVIWSNALRAGKVPAQRVDGALEAIVASANAQHRLIDELLDMSRLRAGKIQIEVKDEELGVIVEEAVAILRPTAQGKNVELRVAGLTEPLRCLVDRGRLHQVLWNVIGNALKFTPAGGSVRVSLRATATAAVIEVADHGIGIHAAFLPHLFDRFRQAGMNPSYDSGLGLGLAIARQLVEMHGGVITAASEGLGRGATFRIELPLGAAGVEVKRDEGRSGSASFLPWPALTKRRILVVEDESHTRAVLKWLLETCGAEVVAVAEGGAARQALALGARFDALVCDIGLAGDDGCALLQALRQLPGARLPALALTAYVRREDRDRALAAGFDAFLPKPILPETFIEAVSSLVECPPPAEGR